MPITLKDIDRFTSGDCLFLAKRLNKVYGLPMYAFNSGGEASVHAFVIYRGKCLDVTGLHSKTAFVKLWGDYAVRNIIPLTPERIKSWEPKKPHYGHGTYRRARIVADILMAEL